MESPDDPFPEGFDFVEALNLENEIEPEAEPEIAPGGDEQVRISLRVGSLAEMAGLCIFALESLKYGIIEIEMSHLIFMNSGILTI